MAQVQQKNLCETCVREEKGREKWWCVYREGDKKKWCYAPWDADGMRGERGEDQTEVCALDHGLKKMYSQEISADHAIKSIPDMFCGFFLEYKDGRNLKCTHICQKLTSINWPPFFLEYRYIFSTNNNFGMKTTELFWPLCIRLKNKRIFLPPPLLWFCHWLLISWVNTKVHPPENHFERLPVLITTIIFSWKPQNLQD